MGYSLVSQHTVSDTSCFNQSMYCNFFHQTAIQIGESEDANENHAVPCTEEGDEILLECYQEVNIHLFNSSFNCWHGIIPRIGGS